MKLNQKFYLNNKITPYFIHSLTDTYLHAIILSTISYCLQMWSLTTKETTLLVARLYNRVYKSQGNLPPWSDHCTALSHSNVTLTFQNYTTNLTTTFYFQIQNNNSPPTLTALLLRHNKRQNTSPDQFHMHLFHYRLTKTAMVRNNFFTHTLKSEMRPHITLEQ